MRSLALVVRIFLVATSALPQELPLSKDQQEVWNREEAYGAAIRSRNADAYLSLLHEDFVGWPYFDHYPVRKSDVRKDPFPLNSNAENVVETDDFKRKAVRTAHTWMKSHGAWLIVGGMSSLVEPPAPSK
jgi:hypothetical protein